MQVAVVVTSIALMVVLVVLVVICTAATGRKRSRELFSSSSCAEIGADDWATQHLYQLLKDTHEVLGMLSIPYVIEGGTLLGAVRHGGMIPHDDDADISILKKDRDRLVSSAFPELKKIGYGITPTWFGYKVFPLDGKSMPNDSTYKYPFLDIFIIDFDDSGKSYMTDTNNWRECYFDKSTFFDLRLYKFGPLQLYGPANPYTYLNSCFGDDWNTTWYQQYDHSTETVIEKNKTRMDPGHYMPREPKKALKNRFRPA